MCSAWQTREIATGARKASLREALSCSPWSQGWVHFHGPGPVPVAFFRCSALLSSSSALRSPTTTLICTCALAAHTLREHAHTPWCTLLHTQFQCCSLVHLHILISFAYLLTLTHFSHFRSFSCTFHSCFHTLTLIHPFSSKFFPLSELQPFGGRAIQRSLLKS